MVVVAIPYYKNITPKYTVFAKSCVVEMEEKKLLPPLLNPPPPPPPVPIPLTVEKSWVEEIYPAVPRPIVVDLSCVSVIPPPVPIPETVEKSWVDDM